MQDFDLGRAVVEQGDVMFQAGWIDATAEQLLIEGTDKEFLIKRKQVIDMHLSARRSCWPSDWAGVSRWPIRASTQDVAVLGPLDDPPIEIGLLNQAGAEVEQALRPLIPVDAVLFYHTGCRRHERPFDQRRNFLVVAEQEHALDVAIGRQEFPASGMSRATIGLPKASALSSERPKPS